MIPGPGALQPWLSTLLHVLWTRSPVETRQGERPRTHDVRVRGRERLELELLRGLLDVLGELLLLGVVQVVGQVDAVRVLVYRERGQGERCAVAGGRRPGVDDHAVQGAEVDTNGLLDTFFDESPGVQTTNRPSQLLDG